MFEGTRLVRAGLLVGLALVTVGVSAQGAVAAAQLREDFRIFRAALEEAHPGLYRYTSRAEMDALFTGVESRLTTPRTQHEMYLELQPIIGAIRDGHTKFHPDTVWGGMSYFNRDRQIPLVLHIADGRGWVLRSTDPGLPAGAEVLAIDDRSIQEILSILLARSTFVDGNGPGARAADVGAWFPGYYGNYIGASDVYRVRLRPRDTADERTVEVRAVPAVSAETLSNPGSELPPVSLAFPKDGTALLTVRVFLDEGGATFPRRLREAFASITSMGVNTLIIDLRGNEGGTDSYGALLYSYLATAPFRYYDHLAVTRRAPFTQQAHMDLPWFFPFYRIFIARAGDEYRWTHKPELRVLQPRRDGYRGRVIMLVDGRSFSVTSEVAAVARSQDRAIFVGEETGGAYGGNTSGFFAITRLPNTHLIVGIPLWGYYTAVTNRQPLDRGVLPDHVVTPTIHDLLEGQDPVLEKALSL